MRRDGLPPRRWNPSELYRFFPFKRLSQKQEKFKISHSERSEESSKINRLRKLDSSATHQNDTFETASGRC